MDDNKQEASNQPVPKKRPEIGSAIIAVIMGIGLMYGCGWSVIWGNQTFEFILQQKDFILDSSSILLRVNDKFYGLAMSDRFFDSPAISWIALGGAFSLLMAAFSLLFPKDEKKSNQV